MQRPAKPRPGSRSDGGHCRPRAGGRGERGSARSHRDVPDQPDSVAFGFTGAISDSGAIGHVSANSAANRDSDRTANRDGSAVGDTHSGAVRDPHQTTAHRAQRSAAGAKRHTDPGQPVCRPHMG